MRRSLGRKLLCLILPLLLAATVSPGRAWAVSGYDDLLQVTSELYVYTDWPTNSQTLDLSSTWWNEYKEADAIRQSQNIPWWPTDFVSRFESILADGGSWGVAIQPEPSGNLITIFGTHDPDATCRFTGPTESDGLSCSAGSDYDSVWAQYFTHYSFHGNGCGIAHEGCTPNGMVAYEAPSISDHGGGWFFPWAYKFYTMHFAVDYPDGYEGPLLPGARAVAHDDQDHDGLLDSWETNGLDVDGDGVVDVDLPAMGAAVDQKDIFVEVDWMAKATASSWDLRNGDSYAPDPDALKDVAAAFLEKGIRVHIDAGPTSMMNPITREQWGDRSRANPVPHVQNLVPIGSDDNAGYDWSRFNATKAANFDSARRRVFRYAMYGDRYGTKGGDGGDSSGIAQVSVEIREGDSFLITQGPWDNHGGFSRRQEAGTFMHELGHTLGLKHGGGDDYGYKPNYLGVMNYTWQMTGNLDYSETMLPSLDERWLDETVGVPGQVGRAVWYCPDTDHPLVHGEVTTWLPHGAWLGSSADWDCDGSISAQPVSADVNQDNEKTILLGYNDWNNLTFVGGNVGSNGVSLDDQYSPPAVTPAGDPEPSTEELKAAGAYGEDGDGTVTVIGPSVLFSGVDNQHLQVEVTNMGEAAASYVVSFSGLPGVTASVTTDTIDGYGSQRLTLHVQADELTPADYAVHAILTRPGDTEVLSHSTLAVIVPDMEDPTVRAQAEDALREFSTPQDGLDESIRAAFVAAVTPLVDQDGDGVFDDEDGCPDQAGTAAGGCAPLMQFDGPAPVLVGDAKYGSTISATLAVWPDGTDLALQWNRDGSAVPGRTGATYQIGQDDLDHEITVTVTASKTGYETKSLTSAPLVANTLALTSTPTPTVTGKARPNHRLTAKVRTWAPAPVTLSFQWLRDGAPIPGATGLKYKAQTADGGARLSIQVTGSKPGYASVSKVSKTTKMVPRTKLKTATPTIGGTPQVGSTLTAKSSKWTSGTTLTHQWFRSGKKVTDATGPSYVLTSLDQGTKITVKITGTKQGYTTVTKTSKPTRKVT